MMKTMAKVMITLRRRKAWEVLPKSIRKMMSKRIVRKKTLKTIQLFGSIKIIPPTLPFLLWVVPGTEEDDPKYL